MSQLQYDRFLMLNSKATQIQWLPVVDREVTDIDVEKFVRLSELRKRGKKPIGRIWTGSGWVGLTADAIEVILTVGRTIHGSGSHSSSATCRKRAIFTRSWLKPPESSGQDGS